MNPERRAQDQRSRVERLACQAQMCGYSAETLAGLSDLEWRLFAIDGGIVFQSPGPPLNRAEAVMCGEVVDIMGALAEATVRR